MSWTRQVTIWCDSCAHWEQLGGSVIANARRTLRAKGWVHRGGRDLCPGCASGLRTAHRSTPHAQEVPDGQSLHDRLRQLLGRLRPDSTADRLAAEQPKVITIHTVESK